MRNVMFRLAVLVCALGAGLISGSLLLADASEVEQPVSSSVEDLPEGAPNYPVNERGETYGSALFARTPEEEPDLVAAVGEGGVEGFVRKTDLEGEQPTTPAEALRQEKAAEHDIGRTIPLYEFDGVTVIGAFAFDSHEELVERQADHGHDGGSNHDHGTIPLDEAVEE